MTFDQKTYMKEYRKRYMPSYMKVYKPSHINAFRRYDSDRYYRVKSGAIALLGGKCGLCWESESEFLTIDHVNNDGNVERSKLHHKQIFARIMNGSVDLKRYRVLCRNCNSGLANKLSLEKRSTSSHPLSDELCRKCGSEKILRTSNSATYGTRTKIECLKCIKIRNHGLRISALALFGSKCKCCCENHVTKLTFDHVNNDGSSMRSIDRCGTAYFYKNLLSKKLDSTVYQVLCWNCNYSKYLGDGLCVHQRKG